MDDRFTRRTHRARPSRGRRRLRPLLDAAESLLFAARSWLGLDARSPRSRRRRRQRVITIAVPTALLVGLGLVLSAGASAHGFHHWGHWNNAGWQGQWQAQQWQRQRWQAQQQAQQAQAAAAAVNPNCTLIVPADPLTAAGLATPYQLTATDPAKGPCSETNANQSAFVQGAIISPAGQVTLYDPLVITKGTMPAAPPAPAQVPAGSTVAVWFGFNGTNLTLANADGTNSLQQGNCVNGLPGSIFGQFASCNGQNFFAAANAALGNGQLAVPPLGTAKDGMPCPTVRDFSVVDQDQSDNVTTHYLANANGQTAQNNAAGKAAIQNATDLANGSDNLLLNTFILPTLGCAPFTLPNGANDAAPTPSLVLDELQAAAAQGAPVALVPQNDPMTQVNATPNVAKMNLYRAQVDQPQAGAAAGGNVTANDVAGNPTTYCANVFNSANGIVRVFNDMAILQNGTSPQPAMATNLFTFLAMRGNQSFTNLNCQNLLNQPNPIALTMNNNVVTAATFTPAPGTAAALVFKPPAGANQGQQNQNQNQQQNQQQNQGQNQGTQNQQNQGQQNQGQQNQGQQNQGQQNQGQQNQGQQNQGQQTQNPNQGTQNQQNQGTQNQQNQGQQTGWGGGWGWG